MTRSACGLIAVLACAATLRAQDAPSDTGRQDRTAAEPSQDSISAEVRFIEKVCDLSPSQSKAIRQAAREARQKARRPKLASPQSDFEALFSTAAETHLSRDERLSLAVERHVSEAARSALDAERKRLDARLRHAAIELLVAALDELMLLSEQQRGELRELYADERLGPWRPSTSWKKLLCADRTPWQTTLARGALAVYDLPRSELAAALRPSQMAVYTDLRIYGHRIADGLGRPAVHPRPVAHRRKRPLFELSIEHLTSACDVSDEEQAKLVLASKLDLGRKTVNSDDRRQPPFCSPPVDAVLPAGLTTDEALGLGKVFGRLLDAERSRQLDAVSQVRWRFHQDADLESIVAVFQRRAWLASEQCDALFQLLRDETPEVSGSSYRRLETFAAVSRIPPARWTPLLDAFQAKLMSQQMRALDRAVSAAKRREAAEP